MSQDAADWARIERLRSVEKYDWRTLVPFRNKEDGGHEQPWLRFLQGDNPTYPEDILRATFGLVNRRLALIRADQADLTQVNIHHWQQLNPVATEALVQLTLGAPQIIYNGGLLHCRIRYFDADRRRPGLPADVAALVEKAEGEHTQLRLVNLNPFESRRVIVQAGAFGEHRFTTVAYDVCTSEYPGRQPAYAPPAVTTETATVTVNDKHMLIDLAPATEISLDIRMLYFVNPPSYTPPDYQ